MKERIESGRQLAAILFTDIVGYTTMMQRDESVALTAVRKQHEVLEKTIPAHDGEIYQYYGDGSLSIFNSATQAVLCAFEIQKQMLQDPPVYIRTGIHIGEIYREGGKIFGDGVNVASRIESIAQGGAVLFSRDVYEKVRNYTLFQIKPLGTFEFKNVDDPVEVYALWNNEVVRPDLKMIEGKLKQRPNNSKRLVYIVAAVIFVLTVFGFLFKDEFSTGPAESWEVEKSVAVLPFKNYSGDTSEDYLSTGIAEDILTHLAHIKGLKVISQASSMKYKDSKKDLASIAGDLGVTSLLDGSIQKQGQNIRVSVTLIKASDESIIWRESFDGQLEDILNMQRNVAMAVSDNLKVTLTPEDEARLKDRLNVNPQAYVNYRKGEDLLLHANGVKENLDRAKMYFELAIKADSTFGPAWAGLADAWIENVFWHRLTDDEALPPAKMAAEKAKQLDPNDGEVYGVLGSINLLERDIESAEQNLKRSIELNPNYTFSYERLAWIALFRGKQDEAFALYDKVIQLDPLSTRYKGSLGGVYYFLGKYDEGIAKMKEYLQNDPGDDFILWSLGYNYAGKGEYEKAIETLEKRSNEKYTNWVSGYAHAKLGKKEEAQKILDYHLEKSKTEHVPEFAIAVQYIALGDHDTGLDYLEKSVTSQGEDWFVVGILKDPMLDPIRKDPRLWEILKSIKVKYTR